MATVPPTPVPPPAPSSGLTWGEFLKDILPTLLTLGAALAGYYEARQAHLEALAASEQSAQNGAMLEKHLPVAAAPAPDKTPDKTPPRTRPADKAAP